MKSTTIVYCPICGKPREIGRKHARKCYREDNFLCRSCSQIGSIKPRKSKEKPVTNIEDVGILAPCGSYMMETLKGRCSDYLKCEHYSECNQIIALRNWKGWVKIDKK